MTRNHRRAGAGAAALGLMAALTAGTASAQSQVQSQERPPAAVRAVIDQMLRDCREVGGSPPRDAGDTFPERIDLTGDGVTDWVLFGGPSCPGADGYFGGGSGGTGITIFVGDGRGGATQAWDAMVFDIQYAWETDRWTAYVGLGGPFCGQRITPSMSRAEYVSCMLPLVYNARERTLAPAAPSRQVSHEDLQGRMTQWLIGRWAEAGASCDSADVLSLNADGSARFGGSNGTWSSEGMLTMTLSSPRGPLELYAYPNRMGADEWTVEWFHDTQALGPRPMRRCTDDGGYVASGPTSASASGPTTATTGMDDETEIRGFLDRVYQPGGRPAGGDLFVRPDHDRRRSQDPFCGCRLGSVSGWRVDAVVIDGDTARANVAVQTPDGLRPMSVRLSRTSAGWRVSDVMSMGSGGWRSTLGG